MRHAVLAAALAALAAPGCKYTVQAKSSLDAAAPLAIGVEGDLAACAQFPCLIALATTPEEVGGTVALKKRSRVVRILADGSWVAFEMEEKKDDAAKEGEGAKTDDAKTDGAGEADGAKADDAKADDAKADDAKADDAKADGAKADDATADGTVDADTGKADTAKADATTSDDAKGEGADDEAGKAEDAKGDGTAAADASKDGGKKKKGKKDEKEPVPDNWRETEPTPYADRKAKAITKTMGNATKELSKGTLAEVDGRRVLELPVELLPSGKFLLYTNGWFGATYAGEKLGSPERFGSWQITR